MINEQRRREEFQGESDFADFYKAQVTRVDKGHFVEVGACFGRSSASMARAVRESKKPIRFDVVDTFCGPVAGLLQEAGGSYLPGFAQNMLEVKLLDYMNVLKMHSVDAARMYDDWSLDFVFLDGDHTEHGVATDIEEWWPKIKEGGVLGGHDWDMKSVRDAVEKHFTPKTNDLNCWYVIK
jgi:predicted O-methyltransferase YrrM